MQHAAVLAGLLRILTYNVAGLPEGLSQSRPSVNHPIASPMLNAYDLVLVQEDWAYPQLLRQSLTHPHRSTPHNPRRATFDMGDGLSFFSRLPFGEINRHGWTRCAGHDCLTSKGFAVTTVTLADGVEVDVYGLHMNAGRSSEATAARAAQVEQLLATLRTRSRGRAAIVAGDFNLWGNAPAARRLIRDASLTDAAHVVPGAQRGRIDRVLYRSGGGVELDARSWRIAHELVDPRGRDLSDHDGIAVDLEWRAAPRAN